MADRTSAEVFGRVFKLLAESPTDDRKALAARLYAMASDYDFMDYQMDDTVPGVDDALALLEVELDDA